jgi:PKD-like domain
MLYQHKNLFFTLFLVVFGYSAAFAQWNKDAGYIPSLTKNATYLPSSVGNGQASSVADGNDQTAWQSGLTLPDGYLPRTDLNILLNKAASIGKSSGNVNFTAAADGNLVNGTSIPFVSGNAFVKFSFAAATPLLLASLKGGMNNAAGIMKIYAYTASAPNDSTLLGTYTDNAGYALLRFDANLPNVTNIAVYCNVAFFLSEIAALAAAPTEYMTVDLGAIKSVEHIYVRHWSGNAHVSATRILTSADNLSWTVVATPSPDNLSYVPYLLAPAQNIRYIKVEHTMVTAPNHQCLIYEINAYGAGNLYGTMATPKASAVTVGQCLGINGIWGWGHGKFSYALTATQGPRLYNDFASNARNYHQIDWDVPAPTTTPIYSSDTTQGTIANSWLNWDAEYNAWNRAPLASFASLMVEHFPTPSTWQTASKTQTQSAYNFGYAFANHFGKQTNGKRILDGMEIGNEPWKFDSTFYRTLLRGMATGAKATGKEILVFPCALQAADPAMEQTPIYKNYIGARITPAEAPYLDGLNIHAYSYRYTASGVRIGTYPEHPHSNFNEIKNMVRFRDVNMPNKKLWLTEFGWESAGAGEICTHSECISEKAVCAYATRSLLIAMRQGIERANWFFYADKEGLTNSTLYTRSGVTASKDKNFAKKQVFKVFETLVQKIGNARFLSVAKEDDNSYIYIFGDACGNATHAVAWRPIDADIATTAQIVWNTNLLPTNAVKIEGIQAGGEPVTVPTSTGTAMTLTVSSMPIVVALAQPISGKAAVCESEVILYQAPAPNGTPCTWTITGGEILSGQGTNKITVRWTGVGTGTLKVDY